MKLYKYYSLSSFSKKVLTDHEIFFSPFKKLNDPFEIAVNYIFDCDHQIKMDYFTKSMTGFNDYSIDAKASTISDFESLYKDNNSHLVNILRGSFKDAGIFCLSENPLDVLLWSHYAGKHRGFCVEFDTDLDPIFKDMFKVNYVSKVQDIVYYKNLTIKDALDKKFDCWSYEKEWRIARPKHGVYKIDPKAITKIFLGPLNRFSPTTYNPDKTICDPDVFGDAYGYFNVIQTVQQHLPHIKISYLKMNPREYKVELT